MDGGMAAGGEFEASLAAKLRVLLPHLDERQRRLLLGAEARSLGHGGIRLVARAAGVREGTVSATPADTVPSRPTGRDRCRQYPDPQWRGRR